MKTLKPRLSIVKTYKVPVLEAKAGTTERIRGHRWMETRRRIALAYNYRCAKCGLVWRSHIDQIDHIIPLEQAGSNEDSNLQPLCNECHKVKTIGERGSKRLYIKDLVMPMDIYPSGIPLTIVCGPAAGGKSTYIREHMADGDYLIDMDAIRKTLRIADSEWDADSLQRSLLYRNDMLRALRNIDAPRAWFIVSAASCIEREWWMRKLKPERLVIVSASIDVCINRINTSRAGHRADRSRLATNKWWKEFTNESQHEVIDTGGAV